MGERSGGRFRFLILLGSLLMIIAGFLPWWRIGGESVSGVAVPAATGIGLEGPGLLIYGAALAALVLAMSALRGSSSLEMAVELDETEAAA